MIDFDTMPSAGRKIRPPSKLESEYVDRMSESDFILSLHEDPRSLPQETQKKILAAAYLLGLRKDEDVGGPDCRNDLEDDEWNGEKQQARERREQYDRYGDGYGSDYHNRLQPTSCSSPLQSPPLQSPPPPPPPQSSSPKSASKPFETPKARYDMQIVTQTLSGNINDVVNDEQMDEPLIPSTISMLPTPSPRRFARQKLIKIPSRRAFSFSRRLSSTPSTSKKRMDFEHDRDEEEEDVWESESKSQSHSHFHSQCVHMVAATTTTNEQYSFHVPSLTSSPSAYTTPSPKGGSSISISSIGDYNIKSNNNYNKRIHKLHLLHPFSLLRRKSKRSTEYQQFDKLDSGHDENENEDEYQYANVNANAKTNVKTNTKWAASCGTPDTEIENSSTTSFFGGVVVDHYKKDHGNDDRNNNNYDNNKYKYNYNHNTACNGVGVGVGGETGGDLLKTPLPYIEFEHTKLRTNQEIVLAPYIESDIEVVLVENESEDEDEYTSSRLKY